MSDFQAARINMVESQIHTMGVISEPVLKAFATIRREEFVPADKKTVAYTDEDLSLGQGRFLIEPLTQARLIQALACKSSDIAMDIGCATGYSSAILAGLCANVVAVEHAPAMLSEAEKNWSRMGYGNILPHNGPFVAGYSQKAPYDVILVNGAVSEIPQTWVDMLSKDGRMALVLRARGETVGKAILVTKNAQGVIGQRVLFDAGIPYLPSHEPRNEFVF